MDEYIIVGDTERFTDCLVAVCGTDMHRAEEVLHRFLTDPGDNDLKIIEGHFNLRIEKVKAEDCWWNDPFLSN